MDIQKLIPRHKDDQRVISQLKALSYEQIEPIVPQLLVWLQDLHWPIARPIADILKPFADRITAEIIKILKTDDGEWKRRVLISLARNTTDVILLSEIERIAKYPSRDEIEEEVDLEAIAILNGGYK